ncbi:hypothetical protein Tco_1575013 [Tanacetum coccineum]
MEDHPLPADASSIALSPGYIADSDPEEDEEDPEEDPAEGGYNEDDESSDDDDNDDEEDVEEDEEEEEHLAPADSTDVASPAVDHVPSAEEIEPFKTDESAATPPPPPAYRTTSRMYVQTQTPIPFPSEAEVARILALPTPVTPLSSPLPQIPSPPRLLLTAPTPRFEVGESSVAAAARQPRSTMARRVDYSFVDTDAQDDRAAMRAEIEILRKESLAYERESSETRKALARSEAHNRALEARIIVLETGTDIQKESQKQAKTSKGWKRPSQVKV